MKKLRKHPLAVGSDIEVDGKVSTQHQHESIYNVRLTTILEPEQPVASDN